MANRIGMCIPVLTLDARLNVLTVASVMPWCFKVTSLCGLGMCLQLVVALRNVYLRMRTSDI